MKLSAALSAANSGKISRKACDIKSLVSVTGLGKENFAPIMNSQSEKKKHVTNYTKLAIKQCPDPTHTCGSMVEPLQSTTRESYQ